MRRTYLDHAATTPVDPEVAAAMASVFHNVHGNPSSIYAEGRQARVLVDNAREQVADAIGAQPAEIVFTSGGTEADNLALRGTVRAYRGERDGIVTSAIEHHAILDTARDMAERGEARLTVVPVDAAGRVEPAVIQQVLDSRTAIVSVMHANNEIGTIQPIADIGRVCRDREITFHTDAVQSVGALDFDVRRIPVDLVSLNAHKFYGPKGVGALYVRAGTRIATMQTGGGQEKGRRTGTENVAGIVGMGVAMQIAARTRDAEAVRQAALRDRLITGVLHLPVFARLTGPERQRLPNNASFVLEGVDGASLVIALDMAGFSVSSGSACTSGDTEPSHVILALGIDREIAKGSLRVTVGRSTTEADVDAFLEALGPIVMRLRSTDAVTA
ncbi:MAG TPA: cysteine desulfurase family protein [Candidatus Limnocylindrales bacterium]|nr:cysteine desulfurase family protein [Candidatus Limnocylindrales bacterium]